MATPNKPAAANPAAHNPEPQVVLNPPDKPAATLNPDAPAGTDDPTRTLSDGTQPKATATGKPIAPNTTPIVNEQTIQAQQEARDKGFDPNAEPGPTADEQAIESARARGRNVFRMVASDVIGLPEAGTVISDVDLPKGADVERLIRLEKIVPVGELKPRSLRSGNADDLESFHGAMNELADDCDKRFAILEARVSKLEKK